MLAVRDFVNRDADAGTCILSQAAASKLFPHSPALASVVREYLFSLDAGKVMPKDCQVIGIVGDVKLQDLRIESQPTVYRPIAVDMPNPGLMNFVIYAPSFNDAKNAYLQTLREIAPGSAELDITPISRQLDDSTSLERLLASLSGFFAGTGIAPQRHRHLRSLRAQRHPANSGVRRPHGPRGDALPHRAARSASGHSSPPHRHHLGSSHGIHLRTLDPQLSLRSSPGQRSGLCSSRLSLMRHCAHCRFSSSTTGCQPRPR